jgi:hypothetical protein
LRLIARDQILVGDNVRAGQFLRYLQPATELAHIGNHLLRARKTLDTVGEISNVA